MRRRIIYTTIGLLLVAFGWIAGRAQTPTPEFTLEIDAPGGHTSVTCVQGCKLQGARDKDNPEAGTMKTYVFECGGERCSARANGWLRH
jgi:hypothetical protein